MAQRSNRQALVEGALRCLERLPAERITARAIAEESGANLASIGYHFGSKDALVTEAAVTGLDRWLEEVEGALAAAPAHDPAARLREAAQTVAEGRRRHAGLVRNYVASLARAQHDDRLRRILATGFRRSRPAVAAVLGLGDDEAGQDAGGLALALFHGLLIQALLDPELAIEAGRMELALGRLRRALPQGS